MGHSVHVLHAISLCSKLQSTPCLGTLRWSINASQGSLLSLYAFLKIFFTISAAALALLMDLTCLGDDVMCLDSHSLEILWNGSVGDKYIRSAVTAKLLFEKLYDVHCGHVLQLINFYEIWVTVCKHNIFLRFQGEQVGGNISSTTMLLIHEVDSATFCVMPFLSNSAIFSLTSFCRVTGMYLSMCCTRG